MTFDEMLSEQIKRLPPNLRSELKTPPRDSSKSLLGSGIGLSRADPTGDAYRRDVASRTSRREDLRGGRGGDVIVQGNQTPPAPVVRPQGMDENALVRQAGFAAANSELAPLLSDWRTTPVAALTAAIGGYGRGSYAAQRDLAAGRAEQQKAEREAKAMAARDQMIASLPQDQRLLAELNPDAFSAAQIKQAFPEPIDPALMAKLGQDQKQFEAQMGFNQQKAATDQQQFMAQQDLQLQELAQRGQISQQELALRRAALAKEGARAPEALETVLGPDGKPILVPRSQAAGKTPFIQGSSDPLEPVVGPDGAPILVPRSQAAGKQPAAVRDQIGSEGEREDKRLFTILDKARTEGGFDGLSAEDRAFYERKYRERSKPTVALDPTTGLITQTSPDVSDLLLPPTMQPQSAPVSAPAAQPPMALPLPAAPAQAQAFGPGGYLDPIAPTPPGGAVKKPNIAGLSKFGFAP